MMEIYAPTVYIANGRREDVVEEIIMLDCEKEIWPHGTLPRAMSDGIETNAIVIDSSLTTVSFFGYDEYTGVATTDKKIAEIILSMGFKKVF